MASGNIRVRREAAQDASAIRRVLLQAFTTALEADLVDALRGSTEPQISLVAERDTDGSGRVVGQILFTPVEIRSEHGAVQALGLAPMAVLPECQRGGVGSALVRAGLAACQQAGEAIVVVLGHPDYYPRFGFRPAWECKLYFGEPGPSPAFMVTELAPGGLKDLQERLQGEGAVTYHSAFYAGQG